MNNEENRIDLYDKDIWKQHKDGETVYNINCYIAYAIIYPDETKGVVYIIRNSFGYVICIIYKENAANNLVEIVDDYYKRDEYYLFNDNLIAYFSKDYSMHSWKFWIWASIYITYDIKQTTIQRYFL